MNAVISPQPKSYSSRYNPALDGVRGVAVLLVMFYHAGIGNQGNIGVDIFFVLSGYLITKTLLGEYAAYGSINLSQFYWRRGLRLLPALWVVALAALVFCIVVVKNDVTGLSELLSGTSYIADWTRAFHRPYPGILANTWSLAVEEQFYLVWPLMFYFLIKRRTGARLLFITAFTLLLIVLAWRWHLTLMVGPSLRTYGCFDTRADSLLAGCCVALVEHLRPRGLTMNKAALGLSWIACALLVYFLATTDPAYDRNLNLWGDTALAVLLACLIARIASPTSGLLQRSLAIAPFVTIGRMSYGLYLWHDPMRYFAEYPTVEPYWIKAGLSRTDLEGTIFLLTFIVAAVSYKYMEAPILVRRHTMKHAAVSKTGIVLALLAVLQIAFGCVYFIVLKLPRQ